MPPGNPLVAQEVSTTTAVTGIGIAESCTDLASGISDGSWVAAGLGAVGVGLEVLSMVVDPIGTLAAYGVSWLIEHVEPLKEALDWLAGDPPVIQSFSETWANVAAEVGAVAGDLGNEGKTGTAGWAGEAGDAYRQASAEQADALAGAATLSEGISVGVMIMGEVVAAVREIVRDLVAELVGKLITWALEAAGTLGFATPLIAVQATAAISKAISKISDLIRKLVKTIGNVSPLIRRVIDKLDEIIQALAKLGRKAGGGGSTTPSSAPNAPGIDAPTVTSPDTGTAPSSTTTTPDGTTPDAPSTTPKSPDSTSPSGTDAAPSRPKDPEASKTPENTRNKCNDPIDVATGEMVLSQTDIELAGELPLILSRTHLSSYRAGYSFGRSWACTIDQRLEFDDRGVVLVSDDGMLLVFPTPLQGSPPVFAELGPRWELSRAENGYTVRQPETGRTLHFADPIAGADIAFVAETTDRNGARVSFLRDADNTVTEVAHSGGYRVLVGTDGGMVTRLTLVNPYGDDVTIARYEYDNVGNLVAVFNSSEKPLSFTYDHAGRITRWDDRNGSWYRYIYDGEGRCVANEGAGGFLSGKFLYENESGITRFTDALGNTTSFHFNELNQLVREVDPLGNETIQEWDRYDRLLVHTNSLDHVTRQQYDDAGNLVAITRPDGSQKLAEYNDMGLPTVIVDPDGTVWRQGYDEHGRLMSVVDPAGAQTRYSYDESGGVDQVIDAAGGVHRIENDATGLPVTLTDPLGNRTTYTRDAFGRVTLITDPAGGVTKIGWTIEGKQTSLVEPDGATQHWYYDGEGNETRHVDAAGSSSVSVNTHLDLLSTTVGPDGQRTEFIYDKALQLVEVVNPNGQSWKYEYDPAGNLVSESDFNGRCTLYSYDQAGQMASRTDALGHVVQFERDLLGNVIHRHASDGVESWFEFDPNGRLVGAANSDAHVVLTRDRLGRIVGESVNGRSLGCEFDLMGRRIKRRTPTGVISEWSYDSNGRPVELRTGQRSMTFGHDVAGRETERILETGAVLAQAWDANHRLVGQTLSSVTGGSGAHRAELVQRRTYRYRRDGFVDKIDDHRRGTRSFDLDAVGRVRTVAGTHANESYGYDRFGNVDSGSWRHGSTDAQGAREFEGSLLRRAGNMRYHHDSCGRMVLMQKKRLSHKPDTWHFSWDSDDRLVGVVTPDGTRWRYHYDALGRRLAKVRLADDGARVVERVDFVWDGTVLAEQTYSGGHTTTWEWSPGGERPIVQLHRVRNASQEWIDERFFAIVTDLVGAPAELVDPSGKLVWESRANIWGESLDRAGAQAYTPLRLPGQYFDPETGLNYNVQRYFDPTTSRYISADPLGLAGGMNPHGYVVNPITWLDPLGLQGKECWENATRAKKSTPQGKLTAPQQRDLAKFAGLKEVKNAKMKKQPVFTDGKRFYTYDLDGHNGGVFKVAKTIEALGSKDTRGGTMGLGRPGGSNDPWQLYRVGD